MAIGAFISTYFQNPKFRNDVNQNLQKLLGTGIDMINGKNPIINGIKNVLPQNEQSIPEEPPAETE